MAFKPMERAKAMEAGEDKYFTGRPCKNGHLVERRVSNGNCVICEAENHKKHLANNPEVHRNSRIKSYYKHQESRLAFAKQYRDSHKYQMRESSKRWVENNRQRVSALQQMRQHRKLRATPKWLSFEDQKQIDDVYTTANKIRQSKDCQIAVDHIVPINGKTVCGLHVPWNLCIRSARDNSSKNNRLTEDVYAPLQKGVLICNSALPWNL